jgi:hypothetical protein
MGMKELHQSLIDYEMTMLKAIADSRALSLATTSHIEAVHELAEALLSPVATTIILDDLSQEEKNGLQFLLGQGGQVEGARFARQYGSIRLMGSARLERERPWQSPQNPAEGLWYRGLIFKTFQVTRQGSREIVYIPDDLIPLLKPLLAQSQSSITDQPDQVPSPAFTISGSGRLRENFFRILVYLQTTPVRLQDKAELPTKDKQTLIQSLLPPILSSFTLAAELDFLLHLGQQANLLTIAHGRLRPEREATRNWLQASPTEQIQLLQNTWRADHTWNDLWHVPGLVPQPTGWENSPLLARSKILGYLEEIAGPTEMWLAIDDFIATIKQIDPDFQRSSRDYESWYIQDTQGNFLMGFEHWDRVEGALIRYILTHILLLLGFVDLGCATKNDKPTSFRLTSLGRMFLIGQIDQGEPAKKPGFFRADNNFCVHVPSHANLYDRFQLARFAQLDRYESSRAIYRVDQTSIARALRNGVTTDQITAFLTRVTNSQTPLKVIETIRTWGARHDTVKLEQVVLLRLKHEGLASELRQQPVLGRLLGELINPTTLLVPIDNLPEVRRLLIELGYLE